MNGDKPAGEMPITMIDRGSLRRSDDGGPELQITVVGSFSGWSGPSEVCFTRRTDA